MVLHWIEIWKFLKNNIIKIIIGTSLITIGFILWSYEPSNTTESEPISDSIEKEDLADSNPITFQFFVEFMDGTPFTNDALIEQYILSSRVLKEVESVTRLEIIEFLDETGNEIEVNYTDSGLSKVIGLSRNQHSHAIEFAVDVLDEENSALIAEYFYDYINNGNIPFLKNKNIYTLKEPGVKKVDDIDVILSEEQPPVREYSLIRNIIFGLVGGSLLSLIILLLSSFLTKKLKYSFSYWVNNSDNFLLIANRTDYLTDLKYLVTNANDEMAIIIQNDFEAIEPYSSEIYNLLQKSNNIHSSFLSVKNPLELKNLIFIIEENETTRKWYNKQRQFASSYRIPTVVVQVNKSDVS